jgi:hypothetical protein
LTTFCGAKVAQGDAFPNIAPRVQPWRQCCDIGGIGAPGGIQAGKPRIGIGDLAIKAERPSTIGDIGAKGAQKRQFLFKQAGFDVVADTGDNGILWRPQHIGSTRPAA